MEEKKPIKNLLGRNHSWIDTAGHTHKIVFDKKTLEKPQTTWGALAIVTAVALIVGSALILSEPSSKGGLGFFETLGETTPRFAIVNSICRITDAPVKAIAAGWNDEIFLATQNEIVLTNSNGERLDSWKNDEKDAPTALTFIANEDSPKNGSLLIAYQEKIKTLSFSLEQYALNKTNANEKGSSEDAVTRTARGGALGVARTVLESPGANIRGIASSNERLFVADYNSQRTFRYAWKSLEAIKDGESKTTPPDCVLGAPDDAANYPGLKPGTDRNFCIVYVPESNELYVANSGLFRVDVFNAGSGVWLPERSWTPGREAPYGFVGGANPIALIVAPNRWIATAETGAWTSALQKKSPLNLYDLSGVWLTELIKDEVSETQNETFLVSIGISVDCKKIYALDSNGDVDVWQAQ